MILAILLPVTEPAQVFQNPLRLLKKEEEGRCLGTTERFGEVCLHFYLPIHLVSFLFLSSVFSVMTPQAVLSSGRNCR